MTMETMRIRDAVRMPQPKTKEEVTDKSAFQEILSSTMNGKAGEKKEMKSGKAEEEKDTKEGKDSLLNGEEASILNLFPDMKPEIQETALKISEQSGVLAVEETESAVDQSQTERNPLDELGMGRRGELVSLKESAMEQDLRRIDVPKDQGKTGIHDDSLKGIDGKPDDSGMILKSVLLDENFEGFASQKEAAGSDSAGKLQHEAAGGEASIELLEELEAGGIKPSLNTEDQDSIELKKVSMNLIEQETVKEASTSKEESYRLSETVIPLQDTKIAPVEEASQVKTPETFHFEKTIEQATEEIMKTAETIREGDKTTMKVNLHPEEMGKMEITLTLEDGKLSGKILLENREIRQIFTERLDELSSSLKQSIQIGKFEVGVGDRGEGHQHRQQGQRQMQNPFRGYQARKAEHTEYGVISPERNLVEINLLA